MPPASVFEAGAPSFTAAPDLAAWLSATFIEPGSPLHNPEHDHLRSALIGCLWTTIPNVRQMQPVAAQAEKPFFQGGKWSKARQEQQMAGWFGALPDFVLTFDAHYAVECPDATWCALAEHELLHCAQDVNEFGGPKFKRDGSPVFALRGHDVEEFVSVVRRYGVGAAAGRTADLVAAAVAPPEIAAASIAACCGTCGR